MLDSATKQKINNLRDMLVGKITNPQGQVQQITLALIYKFMSDIDDETSGIFGGASFFPGEFAQYKWSYLMDSKLSAQERLNLYAEGMEKMNHNPAVPALFRTIFKQAFLPYRDATTLSNFLKQINEFQYEHSEDLGDAFEYLLSCLSAAGDAGMFRTPRHIIDFIVDVVQPQITDKILDPACGTAGFLISAYKYLTQHHKDIDMTRLSDQIVGYDISPEMVQLALVNLYLHQFPDPKVMEYDTLTSEDRRSEKFDCILANPPFMTPKGGIQPHNKFSITSNRSEVLFVDYIIEHLKSNGKAGIIVPEGVIFQSANAYKALRKMLIETGGLWGVISLPAGVFNPYAGVKTSVLLIDKTIKSDQIVFAKVTADGYDLGAQRREISKNDIPDLLTNLLALKSGLKNNEQIGEISNNLIWSISKTELADDYNLSAERYKTGAVAHIGSYEMVELGEVCEFQNGYAFQSEKYSDAGYQVMRITNVQKGFIDTKDPKYYPIEEVEGKLNDFMLSQDDILISLTGNVGRVGVVEYNHLPAVLNQRVAKIGIINQSILNQKYLFHMMNTDKFEKDCIDMSGGVAQKNLGTGSLKTYKIPLPPLEVQEQIVKELDGYQAIIDGAKQIINNWKPTIEVDSEWEMVKLGEVTKLMTGGTPLTSRAEYYGGSIKWLVSGDINKGEIFDCEGRITELAVQESNAKILPINSVLIALNGQGKTRGMVAILRTEACCNQSLVSINPQKGKLLSEFLLYILKSKYQEIRNINGDNQRGGLNMPIIRGLEIPLPPLDVQQSIVARIQHEQSLVDSAKELVKIYEEKIKERVERVWVG